MLTKGDVCIFYTTQTQSISYEEIKLIISYTISYTDNDRDIVVLLQEARK